MYLSRLKLTHIRGFESLEIDLGAAESAPRRTVLIGKNGTCKTSVLRSIALGLCDISDANALISEPIGALVHHGAEQGRIEVETSGGRSLGVTIRTHGMKEEVVSADSQAPNVFVCGYGAGRNRFGEDSGRSYRVADAVFNLFDYRRTLIAPELTLRRLRDHLQGGRYEAAIRGIKTVLGLTTEDEISLPTAGGVEISGPSVGTTVRLEGWADGYRMTFNWMVDLYGRALSADAIGEDGNIRGVVLIDEIEQHLHPTMQAEILPRIAAVLPGIQLIATTHSPLVVLDTNPEELVILRREGDRVLRQLHVPDFTSYSAEDVLEDERLFGSPVYSRQVQEKVDRYHELLSIPADRRAPGQGERLRSLAAEIEESAPRPSDSALALELRELASKHGL